MNACLRDGRGGSPTAVLPETALSDDERRSVPGRTGASHAVFVSVHDSWPGVLDASLRFFTAEGELPACGHGTVAALAYLAEQAGVSDCEVTLRAAERVFTGRAVRQGAGYAADFDPGTVDLREPSAGELALLLGALGLQPDEVADGARVASLGRPRLLLPVTTRPMLAALTPDLGALEAACDRLGLLGCYVYSVPTAEGRTAARMFAPSIGVPEDIANANSTACLAAHLGDVTVDMGDSLGSPATITAVARPGTPGAASPQIRVGGVATVAVERVS